VNRKPLEAIFLFPGGDMLDLPVNDSGLKPGEWKQPKPLGIGAFRNYLEQVELIIHA